MLNYHLKGKIKTIPNSQSRYQLHLDLGFIYDTFKEDHYYPKENNCGELIIELPVALPGLENHITWKKLVAYTFKPLFIPIDRLSELDVMFVDQNEMNFNPRNLIWKFPSGGIESPYWEGWYHVPGFTRYLVNEDGEFRSTLEYDLKLRRKRPDGYLEQRFVRDDGQSCLVALHILVAYTFHDIPNNVLDLIVNHKDLIRHNNHKDNLEIITQLENVHHARGTLHTLTKIQIKNAAPHLRTRRGMKVLVKNIKTNEVMEFETAAKVAEHFNTSKSHIFTALHHGKQRRLFKSKYVIILDGDTWPDLSEVIDKPNNGIPRKVLVRHISTGMVTEFDSAIQFLKCPDYALSKKQVYSHLKLNTQKVFGEIQFKYSDVGEWK